MNISRLDINNFFFIILFGVFFYFSDCVKGYYKRAKAHAAVWNEKEAQRDYNMVAHLDNTLASLVSRELKALSELMKKKYWEEKEAYWNMLEKKESKNEEEEREEVKGKQEDSEGVTTGSKEEEEEKDEKESPPKYAEVHEDKLGGNKVTSTAGTGIEEDASEINPSASNKSEEKDWQQMLRLVMLLQNEGNFLIKEKHFQEASVKIKEAIEYVDFLQNTVSGTDYVVSNNVLFMKCKIKPFVTTMIVQMDVRIGADHINGLQSKQLSVMNGMNLPESSLTKRIAAREL